ncbi:MAG: L-threonylcarbamoyladenylate synthase [Mycobacteriales bacterium]
MTAFEIVAPRPHSRLLTLAAAQATADLLRAGGLAVLPTETGYLLAASAVSSAAARKAFAVKQRDLSNPMHVACASLEMAARFGKLDGRARRLLGELTPGPLSVVVPQAGDLDNPYVTRAGTIGLRVPDHPATLQVIATLGGPVTATSLNRSGEESAPVDRQLLETFDWDGEPVVHAVIDPAAVRYEQASTLVRLTGPEPEVLRAGPVTAAEIARVLAGPPPGRPAVHPGPAVIPARSASARRARC